MKIEQMKVLAITIGNNDYCEENAKLDNAINDARGMNEVFKRLGYETFHKENCRTEDYDDLLSSFEKKIQYYNVSIFYYAGHGLEFKGENYLPSIECQVSNPNEYHCSRNSLKLIEILNILKNNSNKINIIIIDACRKSFERGGSTTFAPIQAPKGTLIAFSTSPGEAAKDTGFENHSIYTGALLKYIGRERISVEELFKKVRKTVFNLSSGRQTTWEHTSLIGDFYFNTGQLVFSLDIPYDENVVKDSKYSSSDNFGNLISEIKLHDWYRQNSAINNILKIPLSKLDKGQQFILGRNLKQADEGGSFSAQSFFDNLTTNLNKYSLNNENHVLNGILFEMYFDSNGNFREGNFKKHNFEKIFALRKNNNFKTSFDFIGQILKQYKESNLLFYIPSEEDTIVDIDIIAHKKIIKDTFWGEIEYQMITEIKVSLNNIINDIEKKYYINGENEDKLKQILADYLFIPKSLININCSIPIINLCLDIKEDISEIDSW